MEYLYAPWRGTYIKKNKSETGCVFCAAHQSSHDDEHFVLRRFEHCMLMLNAYPYNPGHLLLIPTEHKKNLHELTPQAQQELMHVLALVVPVLEKSIKNTGTNIGINLGGRAAGGTIPDHLHIHILPRWEGDTNFLPTLAQTKQLSADLQEVYKNLKPAFQELSL